MTKDEAHELQHFLENRIFGWTLAIGCNNPSGRMDGRFKSVKVANRLMRDIFMSREIFSKSIAAYQAGEDPETMWPAEFREIVRFCLWHRVPDERHEPLSEVVFEDRLNPPKVWSQFLHQYNKVATVDDVPPLPGPSPMMQALEEEQRSARAGGSVE